MSSWGASLILLCLAAIPMAADAQRLERAPRLAGQRVRVSTSFPVQRLVVGTLDSVTADSIVVLADALPRFDRSREALPRHAVTRVQRVTTNLRAATVFALILGGVGAFMGGLDETDDGESAYTWGAAGAGLGFALGYVISPRRWETVALTSIPSPGRSAPTGPQSGDRDAPH